jgi:hypothetical protein
LYTEIGSSSRGVLAFSKQGSQVPLAVRRTQQRGARKAPVLVVAIQGRYPGEDVYCKRSYCKIYYITTKKLFPKLKS